MNGFAINAYGEIGICVISQQETFSIREVGVSAVWEESCCNCGIASVRG